MTRAEREARRAQRRAENPSRCRFRPDEIALLADEDLTDEDIAARTGRIVQSIKDARRRYGFRESQRRADLLAERLEDLAWFVSTGESAEGAARRLDMTHDALERWCRRHAFDLWQQLRARDPMPLDQMAAATTEARRRKVFA